MRENKTIVMAAILISMSLGPFLGTSVNLCIPDMAASFAVDAATIGWTVTAYTIALAALSVPMGKISDLTSHCAMFKIGLSLVAIGSMLCGFMHSFALFIACRLIQALGSSMLFGTAIPIAVSMYPPEQRGKTIGICTSAVYVGGSIGPLLGGIMSSYATWEWVFWVTAIVTAVALAFAIKELPRDEHQRRAIRFDIGGNILYIVAIVLFLVGLAGLSTMPYAWAVLVAGIVFGAIFVLVERKAEEPIIRLSMFTKDRVFALSNLAALLNYGSIAALAYLLSIYFQSVLGMSAMMAGLILLSQPVIQALVAPVAGALSDRMAPWKISTLGMSCSCVALLFFAFVQETTPLALIVAVLIVAGFGFGIFASPNTNVIMSRVPKSEFGSTNAIVSTMRTVGQASSMSVVTIVVGSMLGSMTLAQASAEQLLSTIHVCFGIFVVVCLIGIVCSMVRIERRKDKSVESER